MCFSIEKEPHLLSRFNSLSWTKCVKPRVYIVSITLLQFIYLLLTLHPWEQKKQIGGAYDKSAQTTRRQQSIRQLQNDSTIHFDNNGRWHLYPSSEWYMLSSFLMVYVAFSLQNGICYLQSSDWYMLSSEWYMLPSVAYPYIISSMFFI